MPDPSAPEPLKVLVTEPLSNTGLDLLRQEFAVDVRPELAADGLAGAIVAIVVGLMISVRSSDIRVAQQLSGLSMLPVFGFASLAAFRIVVPTVPLFVGSAAIIGSPRAIAMR